MQVKDSSSKFFKGGAELPRMLLFSSKSTTSPLFKSLALEFKVRSATQLSGVGERG